MIGWEYPPHISGGLGIACKGLAESLVKRGVSVKMMVPKLHGNEEAPPGLELFDAESKRHLLSKEEYARIKKTEFCIVEKEDGGCGAYGYYGEAPSHKLTEAAVAQKSMAAGVVPELSGGYSEKIFAENRRYAAWAEVIAKKLKFDAIHAHDWMTFSAGIAASRASRKPLICHVHATEFDRSGKHINQRIYDMEREAFHFCHTIITVSDYTAKILVERYGVNPAKIKTVHNGVDQSYHAPVKNTDRLFAPKEKLVLFLGRITFQKGPDYFVRAAQKVIEKVQNVKFVMAGTGDMYHRMIDLAADLGIGRHFHYTGFLNKEETKKAYQLADLYIMPSVSEPFGISPLEAMLQKIPVIISHQSGVSEIITNCIKVNFWDIEILASQILTVLKNPALSKELGEKGLLEAKSVNWDRAAEKVDSIYHEIA